MRPDCREKPYTCDSRDARDSHDRRYTRPFTNNFSVRLATFGEPATTM